MVSKLKGKRKRRKVKFQNRGWHQKIFRDKSIKTNDDDDVHNGCDVREDEELKQMEVEMMEIKQSEDEIDLSYDEWSESSWRGNLFRKDQTDIRSKFYKLFKREKKPRDKANELVERAHSRHKEYAVAPSSDMSDNESMSRREDPIDINGLENKVDGEEDDDIMHDVNTHANEDVDHTNFVSLPSNAKPNQT